MSFQNKKVLFLGATSGIGRALASKLISTGTSVIVVGRRKDKLSEFVSEHSSNPGGAKASSVVFDITDTKAIPDFIAQQFKDHPDIDSVFLNSGIQRAVDWTKPDKVNLETIDLEVLTNYTSFLHLTKAVLPYLQKDSSKPTSLVFTTSGLALVPIEHCPNYCATKAALHHHILILREQLKRAGSNVKVIEIFPPAVQTELHDFEMGEEKGRALGMPLDAFVEEAFEGLCKEGADGEQIPVGDTHKRMGFYEW